MTALSAALPNSKPQYDLFGHSPLDESFANSISRDTGNDSLVRASDNCYSHQERVP